MLYDLTALPISGIERRGCPQSPWMRVPSSMLLIYLLNRRGMIQNCGMKIFHLLFLLCTLVLPSFAQETITNATPPASSNQPAPAALTLPLSTAEITAPLVLTNGRLSQPEQTELPAGGKAVLTFTITNAGQYVLKAVVNAPGEDSNSFYLNVDAPPEDPAMIWDIDVTTGFEERTVNWRGNGTPESDEIMPKRFQLSAGPHKLIIVGREPAELKSLNLQPAAN